MGADGDHLPDLPTLGSQASKSSWLEPAVSEPCRVRYRAATGLPSGSALQRDLGADGLLQDDDDTENSSEDFDLGGVTAQNFAGTRTSQLALNKVGSTIRLSWNDTADGFTIHKTGDPATARNSAPVAAQAGTVFVDPNPDQFPGLTCYVVKP